MTLAEYVLSQYTGTQVRGSWLVKMKVILQKVMDMLKEKIGYMGVAGNGQFLVIQPILKRLGFSMMVVSLVLWITTCME